MTQSCYQLNTELLSATAFARFGEVIEATENAQQFLVNQGSAIRYHDLARIEVGPEGRVAVSLFSSQASDLPLRIEMLECHPLASQAFMPISGRPYLVVVAPAGPPPRIQDLCAFLAMPAQGVNYSPGTWHHPIIALEEKSDFLVIDRVGAGMNCTEIRLPQPVLINISV